MSATRRAEIGSRGFALRSWRAYGKSGMTAVIRFADASFAAWIISSSSIRLLVDRRRSRSARGRRRRRGSTRRSGSTSRRSRTSRARCRRARRRAARRSRCASSGCERPEKTISRFCGPRSMPVLGRRLASSRRRLEARQGELSRRRAFHASRRPTLPWSPGAAANPASEPGGTSSVMTDPGCNPSVVANLDRSNEVIVDAGPDVAADRRPPLRLARLVREVGGDVAGGDVRVLADLGVADVGEVRDLRAGADRARS